MPETLFNKSTAKVIAATELLSVAQEIRPLMTCESGGDDGFIIKMKFTSSGGCQEMHQAMRKFFSNEKVPHQYEWFGGYTSRCANCGKTLLDEVAESDISECPGPKKDS